MALVRSIGRWALTALVVNSIIGSGIFGVPSELIRLVGRESPLAMLIAAMAMGIIMVPLAELASQFSEPGGLYLYTATAFGSFAGLQIGWFWLLAAVGGGAAGANLFLNYLATFLPVVAHGPGRLGALLLLIAIPTAANYVGVRSGTNLSSALTLAKLLPLGSLITLGLLRHFSQHPVPIIESHAPAAGWRAWLSALLLLIYSYGGYEDALVPMGEVKDPRRTVPVALGTGLLLCAAVYTLLQLVVVWTVGGSRTDRPLVYAASSLLGHGGASFIAVAVMVSTYGWISAGFLSAPRFALSLAARGACPDWLGRLHPRYRTPTAGILLYAFLVSALAATGTFLWVLALAAGSMTVLYAAGCAAMIRMRRMQPERPALRIPFGEVCAVLGIVISAVLMTRLEERQVLLMCLTAAVATLNWVWARRQPTSWQRINR